MPPSRESELLAADRFARSFAIELIPAAPDRVCVAMTLEREHVDAAGRVRSGVAFTIADCAMSLISNATTRAFAVTAHLVVGGSASPGQTMTATAAAALRGPGRVTWHVDVTVDRDHIATFTGTTLEVPA